MPQVTIPGSDGHSTIAIPYSTQQAADLVQEIENTIFTGIQAGAIVPNGYEGTGNTLPQSELPNYVLIQGSVPAFFDSADAPYISVTNTALTTIYNTQSVQTVVSGSSGGLYYYASNQGNDTSPGADVWVSGGNNLFTVAPGATAQFNVDSFQDPLTRTTIYAQQGTSTVSVFSGRVQMYGGDFVAPTEFSPTVWGYTGQSTVNVGGVTGGGTDSIAVLDYVSGSAGGTINVLGYSSVRLDDAYSGTTSVSGSASVALGEITLNVGGPVSWLNAAGSSPTVNLSTGQLMLTSTTPSNIVINPSGNVTIWGGLDRNGGPFVPEPGTGLGFLTVNPGPGSVTLFGGNSGGLIQGGSGGHNLLVAGTYSVASSSYPGGFETTTLVGGGNADTLWAGANGDQALYASYGNTTLVGNSSGAGNLFSLSHVVSGTDPSVVGTDSVVGSMQADQFWLGSGNASIDGYGGGDLYIDPGTQAVQAGATVDITHFQLGTDFLALQGGVTLQGTDASSGTATVLTLSDGLTIKFEGVVDNNGGHFIKS